MSTIGYNARGTFTVLLDDTVIAAISSKSFTHAREPIDTTNDDSDGWRVLLPIPGVRSVDASIEGVATIDNYQILLAEWSGVVNSDVTLRNADGSTMEAEYGFFLGSLEFSGEKDGHVAFTASIQSSGEITITPAPTA
jgi:predicted secreted protein